MMAEIRNVEIIDQSSAGNEFSESNNIVKMYPPPEATFTTRDELKTTCATGPKVKDFQFVLSKQIESNR